MKTVKRPKLTFVYNCRCRNGWNSELEQLSLLSDGFVREHNVRHLPHVLQALLHDQVHVLHHSPRYHGHLLHHVSAGRGKLARQVSWVFLNQGYPRDIFAGVREEGLSDP